MYVFCKLDQRRANIAQTNQQYDDAAWEIYLFKVNFVDPFSLGMMVHVQDQQQFKMLQYIWQLIPLGIMFDICRSFPISSKYIQLQPQIYSASFPDT